MRSLKQLVIVLWTIGFSLGCSGQTGASDTCIELLRSNTLQSADSSIKAILAAGSSWQWEAAYQSYSDSIVRYDAATTIDIREQRVIRYPQGDFKLAFRSKLKVCVIFGLVRPENKYRFRCIYFDGNCLILETRFRKKSSWFWGPTSYHGKAYERYLWRKVE